MEHGERWNEDVGAFAAEWLKDSRRDEVIYEMESRRGKFRLTTTALEAAQARIAALEAELAGAQKERDGVRKALDYLLSDPAVPPSALERTRVLMQHYKAAQP